MLCSATAAASLMHPVLCISPHVLDPMRWIPCAGSHALDPMRWIPCAGSHALDPMRWIPCAGSHVLDPMYWIPCPQALDEALRRGVDLRGYTYWSLLDNFEWQAGYRPRFGLARTDYDSMARTLRPSSSMLRDVIRRQQQPRSEKSPSRRRKGSGKEASPPIHRPPAVQRQHS